MSESTDAIDFYKVDVDEAQDIAQEVGVRAVSSTIVLCCGVSLTVWIA